MFFSLYPFQVVTGRLTKNVSKGTRKRFGGGAAAPATILVPCTHVSSPLLTYFGFTLTRFWNRYVSQDFYVKHVEVMTSARILLGNDTARFGSLIRLVNLSSDFPLVVCYDILSCMFIYKFKYFLV